MITRKTQKIKGMPKVINLIPDEEALAKEAMIAMLKDIIESVEKDELKNILIAGESNNDQEILTCFGGDMNTVDRQKLIGFLQATAIYNLISDNMLDELLDGDYDD